MLRTESGRISRYVRGVGTVCDRTLFATAASGSAATAPSSPQIPCHPSSRRNITLFVWMAALGTALLLFFQSGPVLDVHGRAWAESDAESEGGQSTAISLLSFEVLGSTLPLDDEDGNALAVRKIDEALQATDVPVQQATRPHVCVEGREVGGHCFVTSTLTISKQ